MSLLAYFIDAETAAVDCVNGGRWSADGADVRGARLLARNGLSLQVFGFYEIHKAFASVVPARLQVRVCEYYCKERLGLDAALGSIDLSKLDATARRAGRSLGRRDRWPHRGAAGQNRWPTRRRSRAGARFAD